MIINIKEPIEFTEITIGEQFHQLFKMMGRDEITDQDFNIFKQILNGLKQQYPEEYTKAFTEYTSILGDIIENGGRFKSYSEYIN